MLLPATPGWVSLPVVVGGPRHSWLGSAGGSGVWCVVCGVWCVVCGVWCAAVVCWWGCGWCVVWLVLATPGGGSCVLLPATPGWVSLPAVVGVPRHSWRSVPGAVPRHSWLGFAVGGGVWCVVCGVWRVVCGSGVCGGFVAGVWCGWSLATPGGGSCVLLPATPGWVSLPAVVGVPRHSWRRVPGAVPRHSWLGFAVGGGVWCVVCGVWRMVCGGGVCGGFVAGVWCGWSLATPGGGSCVLLPATPGWVSLPVVVGGPRHSWLRSPGGSGVWWGCGWCVVWLVPRHSWRRFLCATPRHSWLGFAAGGGGRSSPLLAEGPGCGSRPLLAGVR